MGRPWKPGQSGNQKGRPPLPPEYRAIKEVSPQHVRRAISKMLQMTRADLDEYMKLDSSADGPNALECAIGAILIQAIANADHSKLGFLLDRSIGKVVEERKFHLEPVVYKTTVRGDGALVQEVVCEALGELGPGDDL